MTYDELETRCRQLYEEGYVPPYPFTATKEALIPITEYFSNGVLHRSIDDIVPPAVVVIYTRYGEARIYV